MDVFSFLLAKSRCATDGVLVTARDEVGRPTSVDASGLALINNMLPTAMLSADDANATGRTVETVIIPSGVKRICNRCFYGDMALSEITNLDWSIIEQIDSNAFVICNALLLHNFSLPKIKIIGATAFSGGSNISGTLTLGSSGNAVTSVGTNAFGTQPGITAINVYTENGLQSDLTGAPWGAVNAAVTYFCA